MPSWLKQFFGSHYVIIANYYAFVSEGVLHIRGRVLEDDKIVSLPSDNWFRNLRHLTKRILSSEVCDAELLVAYGEHHHTLIANKEGFYEGTFDVGVDVPHEIVLTVAPPSLPNYVPNQVSKIVRTTIIDNNVRYGIISDIDDTILVTGVVSRLKWRLLFNTLFLNPAKRKTFKNASRFYRRLVNDCNPIFYISNSPWNLYDYLKIYLQRQEFPPGYILLRDYNIFSPKAKDLEKQNKYIEIIKSLQACPALSFILIGDAGEVDTDIYLRIAEKHPDRVKAIYIRSVKSTRRMERVKLLAASITTVPILIFDHTIEMAQHAEQMGLLESP